jgi:hypothetical protein
MALPNLLDCIREARATGELYIRFEGHDAKMEKEPFWIQIRGKRVDGAWALRADLGDGTHWERSMPDNGLERMFGAIHAAFVKMGREFPKA